MSKSAFEMIFPNVVVVSGREDRDPKGKAQFRYHFAYGDVLNDRRRRLTPVPDTSLTSRFFVGKFDMTL
jgi:hypothetical protein